MWRIRHIAFVLIIFLSACSNSKQVRRSNRAAKKLEKLTDRFPELLQKDTLRAIIKYSKPKTTLEIETTLDLPDSIQWRKDDATLIRVVKNDSVFYTVICDTVTVIQEVEIPIKKIQPVKYIPLPMKWWQKLFMWVGILVFLFYIARIVFSTLVKKL